MPVFNFGENDIYELLVPDPGTLLHRLQQWLKRKTGFLLVLPKGKFGLPFIPKRKPLTTIGNVLTLNILKTDHCLDLDSN